MLVGSLFHLVRLPIIDKGIHNVIVPLAATGIVFLRRSILPAAFQRFRFLILATAILYVWMWLSAVLSPYRHIGLVQALNYSGYLVSFIGLTVLFFRVTVKTRLLYMRTVFFFLLSLALIGILEYLYPTLSVFAFFRCPESLLIYPRLAALMIWPNQFGVFMALAGALGLLLWPRETVSLSLLLVGLFLTLFCLANTGSRNGWMVFVLTMSSLLAFGTLGLLRFSLIMALFVLALLSFHVSVKQLGIDENDWVPFIRQTPVDTSKPFRRSEVTLTGPGLTVESRIKLWRRAVREITNRPLTGIGVEVFQHAISPQVLGKQGFNTHDLFLNLAVELGLVGLALVGVWTFLLVYRADSHDPITVVPMIPLVAGQIIDCFFYDYTFMVVFMFFTASFANSQREP
jgi:O-antigen ligase